MGIVAVRNRLHTFAAGVNARLVHKREGLYARRTSGRKVVPQRKIGR